jgi:hypothetical protein
MKKFIYKLETSSQSFNVRHIFSLFATSMLFCFASTLHAQTPTPILIKDIFPGTSSSTPANFIKHNGSTYFTARPNNYKVPSLFQITADNTDANLIRNDVLVDNYTNSNSTPPLIDMIGQLFYQSRQGSSSIYNINSADHGIYAVMAPWYPQSNSQLREMIQLNDKLLFSGRLESANANNHELMSIDTLNENHVPTAHVVKDINVGNEPSYAHDFIKLGDYVYFQAFDGVHDGNRLWRTDGTEAGTVYWDSLGNIRMFGFGTKIFYNEIEYINFESISHSMVYDVITKTKEEWPISVGGGCVYKNKLYFTGSDPNDKTHNSSHLYSTDGTLAGTKIVIQGDPNGAFSAKVINNAMYFTLQTFGATDAETSFDIWKIDSLGAEPIEVNQRASDFAIYNGDLYFEETVVPGYYNQLLRKKGNEPSQIVGLMSNSSTYNGGGNHLISDTSTLFYAGYDDSSGIELYRVSDTIVPTQFNITTSVKLSYRDDPYAYRPDAGGTITPSVAKVQPHEDVTFTITPDNCNIIQKILLDGEDLQGNEVSNSFVLSDVTSDHRIVVLFTNNDSIAPVISGCPGNIIALADSNEDGNLKYTLVRWIEPTATDECLIDTFKINYDYGSLSDFYHHDTFLVGITKVTYTVSDNGLNTDTCSFLVTVCPRVLIQEKYVSYLTCLGVENTLEAEILLPPKYQSDFDFNHFQWYKNGHLMLGKKSDSLEISKKGTYSLRVTGSGCDITSNSLIIKPPKFVINDGANAVIKCATERYTLSVNDDILDPLAVSFQWSTAPLGKNTVFSVIAGNNLNTLTTSTAGKYYCIATLPDGCTKQTNTFKIKNKNNLCGSPRLVEIESEDSPSMMLYPNPTNGNFTVSFSEPLYSNARINVYDITGKMVTSKVVPEQSTECNVDLNQFATGIYTINLISNETNETMRIIVQR